MLFRDTNRPSQPEINQESTQNDSSNDTQQPSASSSADNNPTTAAMDTTSSSNESNEEMTRLKNELEELRSQLQSAQSAADAAKEELTKLEVDRDRYKGFYDVLLSSRDFNLSEVERISKRKAELEQMVQRYEQSLNKTSNDLFSQQQTTEKLRVEMSTIKSELGYKQKQYEQCLADKNSIKLHHDKLLKLLVDRAADKELNTNLCDVYINNLKAHAKVQEEELVNLRSQLESAQSQVKQKDEEHGKMVELQAELDKVQKQVTQLQETLASTIEQKTLLETQLAAKEKEGGEEEATAQREKLFKDLDTAQKEIQDLNTRLADYEKQLQESKDAMTKAKEEHEIFIQKTQERVSTLEQRLEEQDTRVKELDSRDNELQQVKEEKAKAEIAWTGEKSNMSAELERLQYKIRELEDEASQLRETIKVKEEWAKELAEEREKETQHKEKMAQEENENKRLLEQEQQKLSIAENQFKLAQESWSKEKEHLEASSKKIQEE